MALILCNLTKPSGEKCSKKHQCFLQCFFPGVLVRLHKINAIGSHSPGAPSRRKTQRIFFWGGPT